MKLNFDSKGSIAIPIAILIAGLLIGGAVLSRNLGGGNTNTAPSLGGGHNGSAQAPTNTGSRDIGFRVVGDDDHIQGNPDAKLSIVEYSDFECPFCSRFHPTLAKIVDDFPDDVNWVYRHFPLTSIHSRARGAAIASECVANLLGNDAFWSFADAMFANQSRLGSSFYEDTAVSLGANGDDFNQCVKSDEVDRQVGLDNNEAVGNGGRGTPFSILVRSDGSLFPFSGALPYEQVRSLVAQELNK